ncbi:SusD/RagB family nutrient-binding outer membrane lipoprotein, partial [Chryseobacterium arthrosphaerae]
MKKILIPILGMTTLLFFNSCSDDFLDVNKNVNEAYSNQVTPKDRLSAAETVVFRTQANTMNRFGNLMMNAWAGNIYYFASPYGDEFRMAADAQFYDNIWDDLYLGISNLQSIIDSPVASQYPHHVAAAKVMKAYYMQMIVDLYNDVPYSEAFKGQANKNPKYDKGKDVYKGLMAELNQALALISQTPASVNRVGYATEDPIFSANNTISGVADTDIVTWRTFWTKMANTVKLKMLVRLSNCTDSEVITWRNAELQAMSTLTGNPANFIDKDVKIQPGYTTANADQRNPFYATFGRVDLDIQDIGQDFRITVASDHMIKTLRGQTAETSGVEDGRIKRLFKANGMGAANNTIANMRGQVQGGTKEPGRVETDFATLGDFMIFSSSSATLPGLLFTISEVRFLQAEAAVVYPGTMAFNAQTSFNDGVTQSFATFGASAADANAYLAAIATKPGMGWNATANKIQAIQYQKWIALTNINPTETFISYNKTGFPQLPMPIGAYYPTRPKRLMYPQSEYVANTANVPNPSINDMYS